MTPWTPQEHYRLAVALLRAMIEHGQVAMQDLDDLARKSAAEPDEETREQAVAAELRDWACKHRLADEQECLDVDVQEVARQCCRDYAMLDPKGTIRRLDAAGRFRFLLPPDFSPVTELAAHDFRLLNVPPECWCDRPVVRGRGRLVLDGSKKLKKLTLAKLIIPCQNEKYVECGQMVTMRRARFNRRPVEWRRDMVHHPCDKEQGRVVRARQDTCAPVLDREYGDAIEGRVLRTWTDKSPSGEVIYGVTVELDKEVPIAGGLDIEATIHCGEVIYGSLPRPRTENEYRAWLEKNIQLAKQIKGAADQRMEILEDRLKALKGNTRKESKRNARFEDQVKQLSLILAFHFGSSTDKDQAVRDAIKKTHMKGYLKALLRLARAKKIIDDGLKLFSIPPRIQLFPGKGKVGRPRKKA
jgi:hypothetical protein